MISLKQKKRLDKILEYFFSAPAVDIIKFFQYLNITTFQCNLPTKWNRCYITFNGNHRCIRYNRKIESEQIYPTSFNEHSSINSNLQGISFFENDNPVSLFTLNENKGTYKDINRVLHSFINEIAFNSILSDTESYIRKLKIKRILKNTEQFQE